MKKKNYEFNKLTNFCLMTVDSGGYETVAELIYEMNEHKGDLLPECNLVVHEDTNEAENVKPMICPLCQSVVQLYQIHFDEKFLMCGNVDCAYPFCITDYHIYKVPCTEDVTGDNKNKFDSSSIATGSTISCSDWKELEKSIQNDGSFSPSNTSTHSFLDQPVDLEKLAKLKEIVKHEEGLQNNLKKIKELNKELSLENDDVDSIDNEKWIKQIAAMQVRSGVQLLKAHELEKVKARTPSIDSALKIDIKSTGDTVSLSIGVLAENKED